MCICIYICLFLHIYIDTQINHIYFAYIERYMCVCVSTNEPNPSRIPFAYQRSSMINPRQIHDDKPSPVSLRCNMWSMPSARGRPAPSLPAAHGCGTQGGGRRENQWVPSELSATSLFCGFLDRHLGRPSPCRLVLFELRYDMLSRGQGLLWRNLPLLPLKLFQIH